MTTAVGHPKKTQWHDYPDEKPPVEWTPWNTDAPEYLIEFKDSRSCLLRYRRGGVLWEGGFIRRWRELEDGE